MDPLGIYTWAGNLFLKAEESLTPKFGEGLAGREGKGLSRKRGVGRVLEMLS